MVKILRLLTRSLADYTFEYSTPKIVTVRSAKIGLLCRFVELSIVSYVIGYAIIYCKGYQDSDVAQTGVTVKVKGVASTIHRADLPREYRRIWDAADYVIPPLQNNAFFILTNVIITPRQKQSVCPEDPNAGLNVVCDPHNNHCRADEPVKYGNGLMTGWCVPSDREGETRNTCEIKSWCPTENDTPVSPREPLLVEAENFTAFIKNSVEYQLFNIKRRNTDTIKNVSYIRDCLYDPITSPHCPIFEIGKMVKLAGGQFNRLGVKGGVVNILIKWDCDLDYSVEKCVPKFRFTLLDDIDTKIAPGWNFRYANYYRDSNGTLYRDLVKAVGILFLFNVQGKAGKFSVIPLMLNVGAGLALLGIAQVLCDWIILYVVKERHLYKQVKFLNVDKALPLSDGKVQSENFLRVIRKTTSHLVHGHIKLAVDVLDPCDRFCCCIASIPRWFSHCIQRFCISDTFQMLSDKLENNALPQLTTSETLVTLKSTSGEHHQEKHSNGKKKIKDVDRNDGATEPLAKNVL